MALISLLVVDQIGHNKVNFKCELNLSVVLLCLLIYICEGSMQNKHKQNKHTEKTNLLLEIIFVGAPGENVVFGKKKRGCIISITEE